MSGRRSKKNQRLGSSRRGPKGLKNTEQDKDDDDDGLQQIAESGDGQNEFHTTTDYHSAQFDHPTSVLECPPHASSHKDSLMETELPERKRKMGSTRKSPGGFKVERKLDEVRSTEDLDEYLTQPNTSATEEHSSLTEDKQSRSSSFPSNLSLQTESSGLGGEPRATLMVLVPENEEKDAIHHREITSHSYEVVNDTHIDKAVGGSVHSSAATVAESDLLREDSGVFNELKTLSHQETPLASTSGQKRRMGSTRRPRSENVGVQEYLRSMTDNERKAEVIDEDKFSMSEEMAQMWDDVARDDPSSHTESPLVSHLSLLAELKEADVSAGTEAKNQSVAFPLVDPEKALHETSSHYGSQLLNKGLDLKFSSHTENYDVLSKVLEDAGSHLSDNNQHVPDARNDTNTSHDCRDVNTVEGKEEVLKQKEEPSRNKKTSSLSPRQDAQFEERVLNSEESPSQSQHNNLYCSTAQLIEGGNRGFDVLVSNISHAEPTATNSPHKISDAVEESQEIYMEIKHENDVCDVASITCDTDLECVDEDQIGSEKDNGFEMKDQGGARDHSVTQIIMEVRDNKEDGGMSTETLWISHQESCEVSTEKEELHREQEYSSTMSHTQSGPSQNNTGKMLEIKEVREDKGETENTVINYMTSKSEEMLSFEDSATETGSHAHQRQFKQSPDKEDYDFSESRYEESEKEGLFSSAESENTAFDRSVGRREKTEGIEGMDTAVLLLDVEKPLTNVNTACNDSKSDLQTENPEQNRVLTEEQNYTSPDTNLEAFQVSDNISAVIDSNLLLQIAVGSEETDTVAEESNISFVIPEDSQDSYKLTTFHSETQENEGDAEIVPVEGDKNLEIQTQNKTFHSSTSEALGTEENIHDVSVLVKEFDINGDTVTVECNRTTELDFLQTSSETLKVYENPENELSSDINISPECSHREEANSIVHKRKMGSTRRPFKGNKGKDRKYHEENETLDSEAMINVEKETFSLEYEPSPDESSLQISKDGAEEQEKKICEKNDVGPVEGSESDLMQSSFNPDLMSEESTAVTVCHITESQTLTKMNEESQENTGDAERVPAEGDTDSHSEIQTENKLSDLATSAAERTEENICEDTVLVGEVEFIVDTVTVENSMTIESELRQNDAFTDAKLEALKVSENTANVSSVTDTGLVVQDDSPEGSGDTDTIPDQSDTNIIPKDTHIEEAHSKSSPIVHKRKMGSTRRPLKCNKGKDRKYHDENETLDSESMINVEKKTFSLEYEPNPDESSLQISKDGAEELKKEICEKNDVGPVEGSESDLMQSSFNPDLMSEESTAVTVCHITESQTITKMNEESQENTGDAERVPAEGDTDSHSEIQTENKLSELATSAAERTEENICEDTVLVGEVEFIVDTVTVENNMTTESEFLQNDAFTDAKLEALKVSENTANVSSVTDTGLVVQDDSPEGSGDTDTIPDQSDTNIIPKDTHREEAHSKSSPIVHKRKMGSTRRPLKGNKGKDRKYHEENETLDSEAMINVEKETFSLEYEPSPDESSLQISKDGAEEQEKEICEKNDVGPVEGSESDLMQSSFNPDLMSEESTAVTVCHITESQTLTKMNEESQENTGDAERVPAEGDTDSHSEIQTENKLSDLATSAAERTEENICEDTVFVGEVEFIVDTVTVENNMTTESEFLQNDAFTDAKLEALKVSENTANVSSVTDTGLVVQDDSPEGSGDTDTIPDQSDTNIIPKDTHREEAHSKSSPIVHKRKMGSTRRPLKGNKGKDRKYHEENETLDSEAMINVEKETFSLEYEPSPDESSLQISKDGAEEQEKEICEKNDVGPVEGSESDLMQSSFNPDLMSEESTAVTVCHITESQTLTKMNEESQENTGDAERVPAEGDTDSHSEIQTENKLSDLATSAAERTEENICEDTVFVGEVEFIVDTVTVENNMTTESEFLQNDAFTDAKLEALKVSENTANVSSVTDTGLVVQDDSPEGSGDTDTIPDQSDTNIIPKDTHIEEAHSKSSPIVHKRKMGSTRRPLKGNKGKDRKYHDENETLDSESMINVEKKTFSLEYEPNPDESSLQISKDGAEELKKEICEKNDVGPVEGSESDLMQSSFNPDLMSEESTAVTVCHITESQTITKMNEEPQENTGDAERVPAEGDTDSHSEIQTENKLSELATSAAERTEENICEDTVLVGEVEFIVDTVTVENNMTIESEFLQNDAFTDAKLEALKVSENTANVSSVTDTGLVVQDDSPEGSGDTETIPDQSDTNIIPKDTHREEAHSKSSPIVHKRKMGSTRRPLKGNKGKDRKYHEENETPDSEAMINVEKETFSLEYEPSPDESSLQISKNGAEEQEKEICEKNDVGPVEGSESDLMQSSFNPDLMSEESTAVTVCHITESQTLTKMNEESQENTGDAERVPAEGDTDSHSEIQTENKLSDLATSAAERTEENICEDTVLVGEVEFIVDTVTVENNMTIESELRQNDAFTDAKLEALKVSENTGNVSSVTDTGLVVQDDSPEGSGDTDTIPDQSDTKIIPKDTHREEAHSKSSPIVHKRKMGSTRRPLKGNKGKDRKYHEENETPDSEAMINVEKETFSLEYEPSPDESSLQISKNGAEEQEKEICEKNHVGPVEGSESDLMQSSFNPDLMSEESTAVTVCHITESQTLTKMNEESQENTGDAERVPAEGDTDSHSEIQTENKLSDLATSAAERTEENICEDTVLVGEVEFIVDTVTVENNMTIESEFLQNDVFTDAKLEALKVSENTANVSSVTDTGLDVQDDSPEGSGDTDTIPDQSDTKIIPKDTHREEAHSKSSPIVHKRKMGSTRRPLKGNKGKDRKYHEENETLDSEAMINVEKETFSLEYEPSPDESSLQISKDGAEEQEKEICEKNHVGPVEGSESDLMQSSFNPDLMSEESTAVTVCHITESQTLTKMNEESQENTGDAERVPAEGDTDSHSEIQTENKLSDLATSAAERTEENICEDTVFVGEVEFIVDTVTVENNMTIESELHQNDAFTDAKLEALKVSENTGNVSSVTDTGLVVQDDSPEGSGDTDTIPDQSDTKIIPKDTHREEAHSKSSPIVHKRKMGSTRRPLKGNKGKDRKYHEENETPDSEAMINVEKETFSLEYEPSPDESSLQISKNGAEEQEKEICEKNDVGPVEGSESDLMQSSFNPDLMSEESTAVTVCHITESQTLTKMNEESQENTGDAERVPAEGDTDSHSEIQTENKLSDLATSAAERTEENICEDTVLVGEVEFIVDTVTVENNMTIESEFLQNDVFTDAKLEALKVSENTANVSSVTDTGLDVQDDSPEGSGDTDTIPDQSDTKIIPKDTHIEEAHSKSSPIVHKRKMGSTRRPLKGNKGKDRKYHEENETLDSEAMINVEKETFSLEYEPSPDESSLQISKDGAEEQEKEICEKNDVGPVEGSESDLMQSSFNPDLMSEESTAVTVCHITESQTLTKMNEESQENTGDAERVPAEGDTDSHSEIQTENKLSDLATSAAERTEENICEDTVFVGEVEFIVDTVTVENNMTTESEFLQNDAFTDAKLEALKVSENTANVSSVTDTGLVVQDDSPEGSGDTDTIPDQSDTNIIPKDTHREEAHSKSSPIVHKRKMGSTRRPLKGNKGKDRKYHEENETLDSEAMINVEKETFSLEYEPSPDESSLQISKDGAEEQEKEICEKNDVGPVEGSESDLMQSSFNPDLMSEESTAVTVCHITESQTLTKMNEESQENTGDAERVPAEGDTDSHSEIQTENKLSDLATSAAERTEENICEDTVFVGEVEFIVDTVTVENNMTTESEFLQNDAFTDAKLEALKVSENTANVSSVTDTGLVVQDDSPEGSGDTDTIPDQSDTNIIPKDTHIEEAHSKSSPIVHKRKMGSTRRPLKGNKGKDRKYHDENETLDSESMINVEKKTFSLEYEPNPDESSLQISKDGAEELKKEICEKNDVGPVEGSESDLMQSSFNPDLMSEESTAVTVCHITESQTITKMNEEPQENTGDAERVPAEGDTDSHSEIQTENKLSELATSAAERTEENICEDTVLVGEVEFIVDTVTVENNMTIESEFLQNDAFTDAKLEALKVSENTANVSSVTDTGLVVQDDSPEGSGDTETIPDQSDTNIIPKDTHREEAHSKSSPIVHKRKMGSTRRPLKGNKGKDRKYHEENETPDSEAMINVEKETFSLEYEPSPDESSLQISKNGAEEQEKEICEKNDVGPVEGSESDLMQSSFNPDLMSEESTAVTVCHITESQTLTKMNEESQENTGDAERVPAEGDTDSHSEIQTENKLSDLATSAAERTEENICEDTVLVGEVEFIVDTVTVENNMTIESELRQNDAFTDAKLEALKVSENTGNVSSVTDTGLVVQDDSPEGSGDTDTIPDQSDTKIIPKDTHREEAHSKSSPIVHKRKMGSTRRPLKGNKGKDRKYHEENETPDSEAMINVEKETFSLEYEPSPDESSLQISKNGAEEQEKEICEKNHVGPVEGSESDLMQSSFNPDLMSEESTAVTVCHITESQTLTKMNEESQENTGDAERVPAEGDTDSHSEIQTENKLSDLATSAAERTEENICEDTVLVGEVEFIVDTVTVENNMTIESEFLQNDVFTDAKLEALKVSENTANVSSVTDTGLDVQDDSPEGSGDTDTIPDQSDTKIIPKDTHREEAHSKSSPIVHKRKMGSTRRPLKGNKGKDRKYHEENETLDSEAMINVEKETFSLEYEPSPDESSLQISKDGAEEQEKEICEKNHVGPVEGSESDLMQSSFNPDLMSEESTAVTVCHITESQTLTKMNEESQENTGDAERVPAEGDTDSHSEIQTENKLSDLATSAAERTEENICEDTVFVGEVEFIVDTVTVENNMTIESELHQNDAFTDAKLEALKVSENTGNVSSVTDTGLVVQDDSPEGSGDTDTIPDQSDTKIIPKDTHREEAHSKSSPIVHKRKMGSTRRPLKGNKGKDRKYHEENETPDSEAMINVEKETFSLEYEPSPDESSLQISKNGAEEQEKEICEKNDVGPVEGSESDLMQSSFNPDLMSEESTAVTVCHITESQTLTKMNEESQENTGDAERVPAEGDTDSHSEIQTENKLSDLATSAAERTEENICEDTVLVGEVEFIVDTVTVENNMTIESEFLQNDVFTDAKLEALKVSENTANVSSVTDTGLDVQDDSPEGSGDTDTIPDQSDTKIIPKDTHIEEAHSKSSPIVHKRKMGSTRRPLKGNKGKDRKYHEENETLDSEAMINVEKETFSLEYEPSPDESSLQISKDGAEEQEKEICEKNHVGPVEGSESDLMQSSFNPDLMSEESTAVTVCHITESQTLTKMNEESQENTGDAERVPAEGDTDSHSEIQTENKLSDLATSAAERTEENICEDTVLVGEVEFIVDTVTVENNMTIESEFLQNDVFTDAKLEALKVSENTANVSSVTDTGLVVQDDSPEGSGDTDTIPDQSDTNIIPKDTHIEEPHSKSSPIVHKRKMGSTRRPLKGNKGQRKGIKYDENETLDSESMINVDKKTFSFEYEPNPDESSLQISKDGAEELKKEICEKTDVGPVEGSELNLMQSSFNPDLMSEGSTAVTVCHITESQTITKMNEESQENTGDAEIVSAEGDTDSMIGLTSAAERTEENICEAHVLVKKDEVIGDTVRVDSDMTTEFDFHQNVSSTDAHVEELNVSGNVENKVSGETEKITESNDINIVPEGSHGGEVHAKVSPVLHKRKMGSTRRPLRGDRGQRKVRDYPDENETFNSENIINVEKGTFSLEDQPSPDESTTQSSKDAQNLTDVKLEALKVSENTENVCSVTDTGLLVQEDTPKGYSDMTTESAFPQNAFSSDAHMEEIDTIIEPSGINIIPEDTHREEAHSKLTPVVHKRKMGSTRRPLSGNKGQRKVRVVSGEEDTETLSEMQDQDNVADHNVTQEIMKIRDVGDEERMNTKPVGMSVQLCDNLEQEQRSDISQTKTGESQDDTGSHLLEVPERTTDFISDIHPSHSDLDLSDALLVEETQIHVSSEDVVMGDTCEPPTEVVETHSVSNRSLQKRKMGSTRKRGNRMVNEEEVEEKEGEAENTTIDDGTTKSEKKLTFEEAIAGSPVHQQPFISCAGKEGHDIQDVASKSDVQTENSDESDQNQSAEMVSGLPLGDVETHSVPEQSEIIRIVTEESQRKDVQSNSTPVIQKRKMGSTRKTLRGNKGQRREVESKKMDEESKGMAKEQDTDPHLATIEGENKLDEDVEQNFPVEFSHQAAISNMFSESEDGVKEVSLNIHAPSEVCEEKRMENTNNSLNDAIDVYEGTKDKFVLTVSREDVPQTMSADYLDQHVHGGSEAEQIAIMCHAIPTQELKITQDDVQHENSSQKILSTKEKKRKMGSTRRNPREMRRENMGDQDRETKKAEDDLDDMPLASSIIQPKEMSSEAVINTDLESEMLVCATDLKAGENDYLNNSDRSEPTGSGIPEHTLQICENQLVNVDVTKHLEPETVTIEKRRKMGSTRKNLREGRTRGKRDAYEDTETADTHLQMSQDSEMSLVGKSVGEQTIQNYSDQSEDSLLIEIERALKKTSQSSSNYEMNVNEPNSGDSANTPDLNKLENSEIKSLQLQPSQISKTHSEPNSPERRRRKMGSTRKNPRQQLKAEREDEDKEDWEIEKNLETNKQELKDLERVEVSVGHNIPENKLNKEYLDVPSAHTSGSQLEESGNPVVQERTSPSTKRKFGSRRTNKGKQGFGKLHASDSRSDLEDGDHKPNSSQVEDNLHNDLTVCDQPISQPIFEQRNMEARNEEAAPKGTGAGLVSLDQIINPDRSTVTRQTINLKNKSSEVQFNVVMVGNSCVGKTSFVRRFHEGQFTQDYRSTIGVDTCVQTVALPEKTVKLQLWDTAGQERFHSITTHVFHKADGLLLMYEITCSKSFISVRDWISQARERAPDDAIMILLGNKNDSVEREVQVEEGEDLAREYNILFMECSAATGANVSESMRTLAELLVQRKTRKEEHTKLRREPPPKKSGCC